MINKPVVGEQVTTPYGNGVVKAVLPWEEATFGMKKEELKKLKNRLNFLLGDAEKFYFEFVVEDGEGELKMLDWSEYRGNFR